MAIEENVIQPKTETTETVAAQPLAQPPSPSLDSIKSEIEKTDTRTKEVEQLANESENGTEKFNDVKEIR